jgi:NAD dependent epimerase/dehydratase family enzyme
MADEMLLASQRVSSVKLAETGYEFRHKKLEDALSELLAT